MQDTGTLLTRGELNELELPEGSSELASRMSATTRPR